jgi:hypothetical protein
MNKKKSEHWLEKKNNENRNVSDNETSEERLAAGARLRDTVALELAPGRRGPLDNSEANRRRPTRAVQVDSDSTSKSDANDFRHHRPTRTPTDSGLHRRATLVGPRHALQSDGEAVPGPQQLAEDRGDAAGNLTRTLWNQSVDALAHLALDRHAAQAPVVQRKPGEG